MKQLMLPMMLLVLLSSCQKDVTPLSESSTSEKIDLPDRFTRLKIGDAYAGGIIFYFTDFTHRHGRVCATSDVSQSPWDMTLFDPQHPDAYNPPFIGGTGTSVVSGAANTTGIVAALGQGNYAAYLCRTFNANGYNDWSLPSKDELNLIYQNIKLKGFSTFSSDHTSIYWSSSEIDNKAAWCQRFDGGEQLDYAWKNNIGNIRATRGF